MDLIYRSIIVISLVYSVVAEFFGLYIPVQVSCVFILGTIPYFFGLYRKRNIGLLSLLFYILYTLPFLHLVSYFWFDIRIWRKEVWGLASNPFQFNLEIINLVGVMAFCGITGMLAVTVFADRITNPVVRPKKLRTVKASMPLLIFYVWLIVGLSLSIISAPEENVISAKYAMSTSLSREVNASSAWLLSYVSLLFVLYDSLVEPNETLRTVKKISIFSVIIYIVFVLQFLRGDRESIPWILACVLMIFNKRLVFKIPKFKRPKLKSPKFVLTGLILLLLGTNFLVGALRNKISDAGGIGDIKSIATEVFSDKPEFLKGTWTAVLLTPFSTAGEYVVYDSYYLYGKDYLNMF